MPDKDARSRSWCFTYNNWTSDGEAKVREVQARYIVYGREVGKKGTPHLQGYVVFRNGKSLSAVRKLFPKGIHFERSRGDVNDNYKYCTKDGDFWETGEKPLSQKEKGEKEQERWASVKKSAQEGKLEEIDPKIYVTHYRTLRAIASDHQRRPPSTDETTGIWYYGESGAGKTTIARTSHGDDYFLKAPTKWWDGYKNQEVVILDDLDCYHKGLGYYIKMWGDKWPFVAEVKGSSLTIRPKKFIVTSQYRPEDIWDDDETISAVRRRFKFVHVKNFGDKPTPILKKNLDRVGDKRSRGENLGKNSKKISKKPRHNAQKEVIFNSPVCQTPKEGNPEATLQGFSFVPEPMSLRQE